MYYTSKWILATLTLAAALNLGACAHGEHHHHDGCDQACMDKCHADGGHGCKGGCPVNGEDKKKEEDKASK